MFKEKELNKVDYSNLIVEEAMLVSTSSDVSLSIAHGFSVQLLQSAALLTSSSAEIESHVIAAGRDEKMQHRAFVTSAILLSWAFVEATINELFWSARNNQVSLKALGKDTLGYIASTPEEMSTLDKYQIVLALCRRELFNKGKSPYQEVNLLRLLRNNLIHYEPEWVSSHPQKIEKQLMDKFELNPFFKKVKNSPFFPFRCLSHGCAEWALRSALAFVDIFYKRANIGPTKYDFYRSGLEACMKKVENSI